MLIRFGFRAFMFFMSLILFGCASDKIVKTYEGKVLPQEAISVLTAPENITVLSVNGVGVQEYLLSGLNVNYGLKTGENLVVFKYESIWSKAKKDPETGLRVDVVESDPLEVLIAARPGAKYTFNFLPANNVREAKELAASFEAQVVDVQNNLVAESATLNTFKNTKDQMLQKEQTLMLEKEANEPAVLGSDGASVIDQLKAIWPSANADEKKEFLVWVFQK